MKQRIGIGPAIPVMAVVFLSFLIIGMALPVLPLHVHTVLGFGPFVVGLVAGAQFLAALVSRLWAGRLSDTRGAKYAVSLGLLAAILGGLFYVASLLIIKLPMLSVSLILIGRTVIGGAESLIITGGIIWGLRLVSSTKSAQVIAWVGMAMFAALAVGAHRERWPDFRWHRSDREGRGHPGTGLTRPNAVLLRGPDAARASSSRDGAALGG